MRRLMMLRFAATPAFAQVIVDTPRGVVVARDGRIELAGAWNEEGVSHATDIVASNERVAVLDALRDRVVIVELADGRLARYGTAATPIAAAFVGRDLYVLCRDARVVQKMGGARIEVAADPAFLAQSNGKLYVYSRATGVVEEISGDEVTRRVTVAPFASDFEVSGNTGYLAFPREARIRPIDLANMKVAEPVDVGAVPVDIALAGGGTALTARVLAVADPSAKRIWLTEGRQSTGKAIARGFLRGFLGLGVFGSRSSEFPTGVDRVVARGGRWVAYDSSSGTLYRVDRRKSAVIAKGVEPKAFTLTAEGVAYWQNGRVHHVRERGTSVAPKKQ
jgi:hypothetical protein